MSTTDKTSQPSEERIAAHQARVHANMLAVQAHRDEVLARPMSTSYKILRVIVWAFIVLFWAEVINVWGPMVWHDVVTAPRSQMIFVGVVVAVFAVYAAVCWVIDNLTVTRRTK